MAPQGSNRSYRSRFSGYYIVPYQPGQTAAHSDGLQLGSQHKFRPRMLADHASLNGSVRTVYSDQTEQATAREFYAPVQPSGRGDPRYREPQEARVRNEVTSSTQASGSRGEFRMSSHQSTGMSTGSKPPPFAKSRLPLSESWYGDDTQSRRSTYEPNPHSFIGAGSRAAVYPPPSGSGNQRDRETRTAPPLPAKSKGGKGPKASVHTGSVRHSSAQAPSNDFIPHDDGIQRSPSPSMSEMTWAPGPTPSDFQIPDLDAGSLSPRDTGSQYSLPSRDGCENLDQSFARLRTIPEIEADIQKFKAKQAAYSGQRPPCSTRGG